MPKNTLADRSFHFRYSTTIRDTSSAQGEVKVWIPLPTKGEHQVIGPLEIQSPLPFTETVEPSSGNRMLHLTVPRGSPTVTVSTGYEVQRSRAQVPAPEETAEYGADHDPARFAPYLAANARVPIDGFILATARSICDPAAPPVVRARKIFDYLMNTLDLDLGGCTPERAHQLGDLQKACDMHKGTCTEFHGLYVAYARALGIPARFQFGFNVPPEPSSGTIAGYHCWAEIFLPRVGWFPIDVSEALKARVRNDPKDAVELYFGGTDCHRVHLTTGRDLWLEPRQGGKPVDKFIFSHATRGDEVLDAELSFSYSADRAQPAPVVPLRKAEVHTFTDSNFDEQVLRSDQPVLVDFWATWCAPCRAIAPVVDRLATEYVGRVKVGKIDVDEHPQVSQRFEIRSIPLLMIFKRGEVFEKIMGAVPAARLEDALRRASTS